MGRLERTKGAACFLSQLWDSVTHPVPQLLSIKWDGACHEPLLVDFHTRLVQEFLFLDIPLTEEMTKGIGQK